MSGIAGVISAVDAGTVTLDVPAGDPITATLGADLAESAVVGVQAVADWVPGTPGETAEDDQPGHWRIVSVGGVPGTIGMSGLAPEVVQAIESAGAGGMTRWDAVTEPSQDGHSAGDMWWQHDGTVSGAVIGQWHWGGSAWIADTLDGAVLANLDAGTITAGALSGIGVFSPSATALPRAEITGPQVRIVRDVVGDGTGQVTMALGGDDGDSLTFYDADQQPQGGVASDGTVTASSVLTDSLSIAGTDILDVAQQGQQGYSAAHIFVKDHGPVSQKETVIVDLQFVAVPGRSYKIVFNASCDIPPTGRLIPYFRMAVGADGATTAAQPTTSSQALGNGIFPAGNYYTANYAAPVSYSMPWTPPVTITQPTACRVALSLLFQGSGQTVIHKNTGFFSVEDMGSAYTGTLADGNFSEIPVVTYERTFTAAWVKTWIQNGGASTQGFIQQGTLFGSAGNGMLGFPTALQAALNGAQSIAWVAVLLPVQYAADSGGLAPRIGYHTASSAPSVFSAAGTYTASPKVKTGGSAWFRFPAAWLPKIADNTYKGISLGGDTGTGAQFAGNIGKNTGTTHLPDWQPFQFKARWTK